MLLIRYMPLYSCVSVHLGLNSVFSFVLCFRYILGCRRDVLRGGLAITCFYICTFRPVTSDFSMRRLSCTLHSGRSTSCQFPQICPGCKPSPGPHWNTGNCESRSLPIRQRCSHRSRTILAVTTIPTLSEVRGHEVHV